MILNTVILHKGNYLECFTGSSLICAYKAYFCNSYKWPYYCVIVGTSNKALMVNI